MEEHLLKLKQLSNLIHPIPENEWIKFESVWKFFSIDRKELLTRVGEVEKYLYFILDGSQRIYSTNNDQKEATIIFTYAPSFGGVLDSFLLQEPSKYFYETLTSSSFLRASFYDIDKIMCTCPAIEVMIRKGLARSLSGLLDRLSELQICSSIEKYKNLMKRSPHLLNLIPHKYIANYIGIDTTNFSKFINNIRI